MKKIGLALQGGGSHGAFTWGVLDRLLELDDLEFSSVCGTSAGAINAVVMSYGLHKGGKKMAKDLLDKLWYEISQSGKVFLDHRYFDFVNKFVSPYQFNPFNLNPLKPIISNLVNFDELNKSDLKLFVCATNVKTNRAKIFKTDNMSVNSILASCCLPHIFQAVKIDDEYYWDGGYMANPPLSPLFENIDITDILLVKINSINIENLPKTINEINDRVTEISFNSSLMNEMRIIHLRNQLIKKGLDLGEWGNKEIFVHSISGYDVLSKLEYSTKMNVNYSFLLKLKEEGRNYADKWIKEEYHNVGKKSSFDVEKHFFNKF